MRCLPYAIRTLLIGMIVIALSRYSKLDALRLSHSQELEPYFRVNVAGYDILVLPPFVDIPEGHSVCELTDKDMVVVPCRPWDQLPHPLPAVQVDCTDLNPGWEKQRCMVIL